MTRLPHLEGNFKNLRSSGYDKTSEATGRFPKPGAYNCIAWAANDPNKDHWWWPVGGYWPPWGRREETVRCFVNTFRFLGYSVCKSSRREPGFEKVALYAMHRSNSPREVPQRLSALNPDWAPTHMARQLPDGTWTSKCGGSEDITHLTLDALESYGPCGYGCPVLYMRRLIPVSWIVRCAQLVLWKPFAAWESR